MIVWLSSLYLHSSRYQYQLATPWEHALPSQYHLISILMSFDLLVPLLYMICHPYGEHYFVVCH